MTRLGPGRHGWELLRIGHAAGRGSEDSQLRFAAMVAAAAAVGLVLLVAVAAIAVNHGRDARNLARSPQLADPSDTVVAWWRLDSDSVDRAAVQVVWLRPRDSSVAPPPGLRRWPHPGEAFLSPALARAGAGEHIKDRYGRYAGTVGQDGLASPSELLAIARPTAAAAGDGSWMKISGFGGPAAWPIGEAGSVRSLADFLLLVGFTTGTTAVVLLVTAARIGSVARERRLRLLAALGAGRRHRILFNIGEAGVPAVIGAGVAVACYVAASFTGIDVPWTGYVVAGRDLRAYVGHACVAAVVAALVTVGTVIGLNRWVRYASVGQTRLTSYRERIPPWRILVLLAGLALTIAASYLRSYGGAVTLLSLVIGITLSWWMLPTLVAVVLRWLGSALNGLGRRRGSAAPLVSGRWIRAHPGPMVRLTVAVVVGLGLLTHVQVWSSRLAEPAVSAEAAYHHFGNSLLEVDATGLNAGQLDNFSRHLLDGSFVFEVYVDVKGQNGDAEPPVHVRASCDALDSVGLACSAGPWAAGAGNDLARGLHGWLEQGGGKVVIHTNGEPRPPGQLDELLLTNPAANTPLWKIKQLTYSFLGRSASLPGGAWLVGATQLKNLRNWIAVLGGAGILLLVLAGLFGGLAEYGAFARSILPLAVLADRRRLFTSVSLLTMTLPLLITTLAGAILAAWQGLYTVAAFEEGSFSWPVLGAATVAAMIGSILMGILGSRNVAAHTPGWRPTAK